jgi:hypothetical protein
MAQSITLSELNNWLIKNKHLTWYIGENGGFAVGTRSKNGVPFIKYIYPSFDTRSMEIFAIKTTGLTDLIVSCSDESNQNLLDLLENKINSYIENRKKIDCKICLGIGCKHCN